MFKQRSPNSRTLMSKVRAVAACAVLVVGMSGCTGTIEQTTELGGGPSSRKPGNANVPGAGAPSSQPTACRVTFPLRRLTAVRYANTIRGVFGASIPASLAYPTDSVELSNTGFSSDVQAVPLSELVAEKVADAAFDVAAAVVDRLPTLLDCTAAADLACAEKFIGAYGARAFRRTLTSGEHSSLLMLFKKTRTTTMFADAIGVVAAAMLQMPAFVFLISDTDETGELSPATLASRLSYVLSDSPPSDNLKAAANNDGARIEKLAADIVASDPAAQAVLRRFVREWIHVGRLKASDRNNATFTPELATAMQVELDAFISDAFAQTNDGLAHLLSSPSTVADATMQAFYNLGKTAQQGVKVTPDAGRRSGLLTMPAVLTAMAHDGATSYVQRGFFVRSQLLCEDFPSPPADAQAKVPTFAEGATQREKSQAIRSVAACASCHNLIDPIGLAFEEFDELGRRRTKEVSAGALDISGAVVDSSPDVNGKFVGVAELGTRLGKSPVVAACMARRYLTFVYGRSLTEADECALTRVTNAFQVGDPLTKLMAKAVSGDEFLYAQGAAR